jgi:hypothetical protein
MMKNIYKSPILEALQQPLYTPPEEVIRNMGICQCPCWCKCGCGALKAYNEKETKEKIGDSSLSPYRTSIRSSKK